MQADKVNVKDHAKLTEQADATKLQQAEQLQQLNQPTIMAAQAQPQDSQAEYERAAEQDTAQQDITQQDKALQDKAQQKLKKKKKTAEQDQTTAEDADAAQADDEAGEEASEETSAETTAQHQQQNSRHESDDLTHQHGNTRAAAHGPGAEAAGAEGTREVAGERANTEAALPWGSAFNIDAIRMDNNAVNTLTLNDASIVANGSSSLTIIMDAGDKVMFNGVEYRYSDDLHAMVIGNAQNNVITSTYGNICMIGGGGADTFTWLPGQTGHDTVLDYSAAQGDKLDLSRLLEGFSEGSEPCH